MFGWFKRLIGKRGKAVSVSASDLDEVICQSSPGEVTFLPPGIGLARVHRELLMCAKKPNGETIRVRAINYVQVLDIIERIETAKRNKKKHSHLLAELKALEAK